MHADSAVSPSKLPTIRTEPLDPPPELLAMRSDPCPLRRLEYPGGRMGWLVSGHAAALAVLNNPSFTSRYAEARPPVGDPANTMPEDEWNERKEASGILIFQDPPQHTRIRRALAGHFTAASVGALEATMRRIAFEHLDSMAKGQPADLVSVFALPFSSCVICALMGVPDSERGRFERPTAIGDDPRTSREQKVEAIDGFLTWCHAIIAGKRAEPGDDLLSKLVLDSELSDEEIAGIAFQLFGAGHDTTASMIALGAFTLLRESERWDWLRENPHQIDPAVEELLRYLTIVQRGAFTRTALEEVEVAGATIAKGEDVTVALSVANRDPEKFTDPDVLDLAREERGHVAFGHGRHICLGQHFARLEIKVGLRALIERFPTLRLAIPSDEVTFRQGDDVIYGVASLPVSW